MSEPLLEELAHFYHQRSPSHFSMLYPMPVVSRWNAAPSEQEVDAEFRQTVSSRSIHFTQEAWDHLCRVNSKRRRFGRFIGLQGMESPAMEAGVREDMQRWVDETMRSKMRKDEDNDRLGGKHYFRA